MQKSHKQKVMSRFLHHMFCRRGVTNSTTNTKTPPSSSPSPSSSPETTPPY